MLSTRQAVDKTNLAIEIYGRRIYKDQTLYEYFLEFMLVFLAKKVADGSELPGGVLPEHLEAVRYAIQPRVGLKRLLFFSRSKRENRFRVDEEAYAEHCRLLRHYIESSSDILSEELTVGLIQDLFCGFTAVQRNRSWFAQSLFPICPEVVFPEAMGHKKQRRGLEFSWEDPAVDNAFEFHGYYFMARGGEVYYLHLLQGLETRPDLRSTIEGGLNALVTSFPMFSTLATWADSLWNIRMKADRDYREEKECGRIPSGYKHRSAFTCQELANLLRSEVDPLRKMEILSLGIVLQILRMMHEQASSKMSSSGGYPVWVIHVPGCDNPSVRRSSIQSYCACEDDLISVLYAFQEAQRRSSPLTDTDPRLRQGEIKDASDNSHKLFRRLGKEIGLIVPPKGTGMRFSLSEDLIRFLVLSLVPPGKKVLMSEFLDLLFDHFGIVVAPRHASSMPWLHANEEAFRTMMKECGFLRDLSDATAIVENPFKELAF